MQITVFGTGYVGLVQAAVLAEAGHKVLCVDVDNEKISNLKQGIIPIYEPGLENLVKANYSNKRLNFTTNASEGVKFGSVIFIAVGTPPDENGSADLQYVLTVAATIAEHMDDTKIVVNKSTVPVGTADKVENKIKEILASRKQDINFYVASNPEFLKEGCAVLDCQKPDRIIIGSDSQFVRDTLTELYAPFNRNHNRVIFMDVKSAELTKYASNCMLATKISFMNEIANLAEKLGADIEQIRQGMGSDVRIGYHFIYPGCGYGGSCFPKDVQALIQTADDIGYNPEILKAVENVNYRQKSKLIEYLDQEIDSYAGKTFALWGLSFKPNTDDMREAPSRTIMELLWKKGAKVVAFDPKAMDECKRIYGDHPKLSLASSKEEALDNADALIICTEWTNFKAPDFEELSLRLRTKLIIDGRNLFDPALMKKNGFKYYAIGRGMSIK